MEISLFQLILAFGYSILLGLALAIVYEPIRAFHEAGFTKLIHYYPSDIIYMIFVSVVTYYFALAFLEGSVRVFIIIGEILGFFVFNRLITPILDKIYIPIFKFCKKIFRKLLKIIGKIMYNVGELYSKLVHIAKGLLDRLKGKVINNGRSKRKCKEKKQKYSSRRNKAKEKKKK